MRHFSPTKAWSRIRLHRPWLILGWSGGLATFLAISACSTTSRTVFLAPDQPGAEFVGSEDCMLCHEDVGTHLETSPHARLVFNNEDDFDLTCESCHGPGSFHSEEGGGRHLIHNPGREPDTCLRCHQDVQGDFLLPHHHPIENGLVACIDCHSPHGGDPLDTAFNQISSDTYGCAECHTEQAAPHVFEHEAMREGCIACHQPHGSPNDKMLTVRNANLCLQCHFTEPRNDTLMIGGVDHSGFGFIQAGTCWTAGCHEAVHGSNVNGSLRY